MNIVTTTNLRNNLADAFKKVAKKKDYLLVAKKGKITSALVDIDFFEDLLDMSSKDFKASLKKARKEYENGQVFTHEQVFGDL